jgi:hypothetical protein
MKSKSLIALIFFSFTINLFAQVSDKDLKKHLKEVEESRLKSKGISSLDTFFCKGKPLALIKINQRHPISGIEDQSFNQFETQSTLIVVTKKFFEMSPGNAVVYDQYYFPGLNLFCDVRNTLGSQSVYETICQFGLLNENGVDTVKTELFAIVKGRINPPVQINLHNNGVSNNNNYDVIVPRNKNSFIMFFGDNIQQDSKLIGSITKNTVNGQSGSLNQYLIFNSVGAMICTATESGPLSREWNLLVYKNNKFYKVTAELSKDKEAIIKLLVDNGFL